MKDHRGWLFPDSDRLMSSEMKGDGLYQADHLAAALRHVTDFRMALDAGAHVGTWSRTLSTKFEQVLAFEPSPDTFECLLQNMASHDCANVTCRQAALGSAPGTVSMRLNAENVARANTGARYVEPGGEIPCRTIDSYALTSLGFLKLDSEGSEYAALLGAEDTLVRCRPVILCETKWLWSRYYGLPKNAVDLLLRRHRYDIVETIGCDRVWRPRP